MREIDNFYSVQVEPVKSCLLALRQVILAEDYGLKEAWKYRVPFFLYKEKMFCYLWKNKKTGMPYIGIVSGNKIKHPALVQENRVRMKILPIDPEKDLPVKLIRSILKLAVASSSR
ncbi:MAG: DUF1801 domain-containing protein [Chryseolinea sp.]